MNIEPSSFARAELVRVARFGRKRRLIDTFPEHGLLLDTGLHGRSGDHGRG